MEFENQLKILIRRLDKLASKDLGLIPWSAPVISFGSIKKSKIATLGLNPSDKEFINKFGKEIDGKSRRFHTLSSLGIESWSEIGPLQIKSILEYCNNYFMNNPYNTWFKKLDYIISGTRCSYYFPYRNACHLDMVPYATKIKWGDLKNSQKDQLLNECANFLGKIVNNSSIEVLVLNGRSVVDNFSKISNVKSNITRKFKWDLPRKTGNNVKGFSFVGSSSAIGNTKLAGELKIIGFNHNLQSSYGVTNKVRDEIRNWITEEIILNE